VRLFGLARQSFFASFGTHMCVVCMYTCVEKGQGRIKKRDRARRGPGRRTFLNSKIPRPEGTAPQDAVACRTHGTGSPAAATKRVASKAAAAFVH